MNTTSTPKAPDIAAQIIFAMRNMGVVPIPRNYNLFYEAYIGSNPALTRELSVLGSRATQEELDELGARYFDHNHGQLIEAARDKLQSELNALLIVLQHEQTCLENYNRILDETRAGISDKSQSSAQLLRTAISMLADATSDKMAENETTSRDMDRHAEEMQQVRLELDEYKRIANTDSLTRLSNRRAFDEKLASVYDTTVGLHLSALVLLDVDNFKNINDAFGHPVGDKILASVASVIRASVRKDGFVARSGGEEFAIIMENSNQDDVQTMCERIAHRWKRRRSGIPNPASITARSRFPSAMPLHRRRRTLASYTVTPIPLFITPRKPGETARFSLKRACGRIIPARAG